MGKAVVRTVKDMGGLLTQMAPRIQAVLPKHMDAERLAKVALTAMSRNPRLLECTAESILLALTEAGQLGLEPAGVMGQAYLIPYKNNNRGGIYEAQFQPGYRGLVELVLRAGDVSDISARPVYEGDAFKFSYGLTETLDHTPRGEEAAERLTHVYAIARFRDPHTPPKFLVMTRSEVEKVRTSSKAGKSGPWVEWYVQMCLKTVIKRLTKTLRMTPELQAAVAKDDAVEAGQPLTLTAFDPNFGDPPEPIQEPKESKTSKVKGKLQKKSEAPPEVGNFTDLKDELETLIDEADIPYEQAEAALVAINDKDLGTMQELIVVCKTAIQKAKLAEVEE